SMVCKITSSTLTGMTGQVVLNAKGKALTFIPGTSEIVYNDTDCIIVAADGSTDGFADLAEGSGFRLYRNGKVCTPADIRKWDVATYDVERKVIELCDQRLNAYYEYASPDAEKPQIVYLLGGNTFDVLEGAEAEVAAFTPGQQAVFLFTADGKIAGAAAPGTSGIYTNTTGAVDTEGNLTVELCGQSYQLPGKQDKSLRGETVELIAYTDEGAQLRKAGLFDAGEGAVIVQANGSTAGFDLLTGGASYTLYKNGSKVTAEQIRKYDVATFDRTLRRIELCDTRVSAYYEDCTGSPKSPDTITVMGREFIVLDSAKAALGQYKPGKQLLLLFTADGKIAGVATEEGMTSNMTGSVSKEGTLTVTIGKTEVALDVTVDSKFYNSQVRVSSFGQERLNLIHVSGDDTVGSVVYGKVTSVVTEESEDEDGDTYTSCTFTVTDAAGDHTFTKGFVPSGVAKGKYIAIHVTAEGIYSWLEPMTKLSDIPATGWIGNKAVTYGTSTYLVTDETAYYNLDTKTWTDKAKFTEYASSATLYVYDGEVRVVEFAAE
ncbi:MAG: hypothetical protein HUJ80_05795, partial [Firmicutes bacterium]|nr:hypothetical protein [Bacillota bacterium]